MAKVLVAGGCGFIGSHLSERLLADGHSVVSVDNLSTGRKVNVDTFRHHPRFSTRWQDVAALPLDSGPFEQVFHLASPASPPAYCRLTLETLQANSEGTRRLLEVAARNNARFVYASTSEIYGDPLEHPQRESYRGNVSTTGPRSMYDEAKRFGEAVTAAFVRVRGVDARIVRIFNTYGPRSDPADGRMVPNFIGQALRGEPLTIYGDGSQTRSLCYVSDLVRGLVAAMERPGIAGEIMNLGNPCEHTVLEFARLIAEIVGSESGLAFLPQPVGDDPARRRPDVDRAKELLAWAPQVELDVGLAATVAYFRDTGRADPMTASAGSVARGV